jgi:hypothetical protein
MANSTKFKDLESLAKKFPDLRYRVDDRTGEVSIPDEKENNWLRVDEGDSVEAYGTGYTIVKK